MAFNTYAHRFLYRTISWNWCRVPLKRILQLLRPALQHPGVASNIKHVDLRSTEKHTWRTDDEDLGVYYTDPAHGFLSRL